ncbi:MAG TPA: hypothetical protein VEY95_00345 [Azospirillaceae bacterium]|nr:hypothetical protein [Azospirillaceae bacterium]
MRKKILAGLRAAQVLLALKAAVGGGAAALAFFGIGADYLGFEPSFAAEGTVSAVGAALAIALALRGA